MKHPIAHFPRRAVTLLLAQLLASASAFAQPPLELITEADPNQQSATAGALMPSKDCYSADGRFVVFNSTSGNLVAGQADGNGGNDIFLHDRVTATTVLVSHAAGAAQTAADDGSMVPAISADGRWVVYWSSASDLVDGLIDNAGAPDVFLYDRLNATNILVSHLPGLPTTAGDSNSFDPAINADGGFVFFTSSASDLVPGQTNGGGGASIFAYDRIADSIVLVTHAAGVAATTSNGFSFGPVPSADGAWLAYTSNASNLVPGQTEDARRYDIFLWNRTTGESALVNHAAGSPVTAGNSSASFHDISADGNYIAYHSPATNLVATQADANQASDVFFYDRATATNRLISHTPGAATTTGNASAIFPAMSADGAYVIFQSTSANLVPQDLNNVEDIFLWDRASGANTLITRSAAPVVSDSANGRSFGGRPSGDGNWIVFSSFATDLADGQSAPSSGNVFIHDRLAATTRLLSHTPASPATNGNGQSVLPIPSDDGAYVAFNTQASDLVAQDNNGSGDVIIHDRAANTNTAASLRPAGAISLTPNGNSGSARSSADGRFVVFASEATNFVPGQTDSNNANDIFMRDRETGQITLVSHAAGAPAAAGNELSDSPAISADGRWIAYASRASDLIAGGMDLNLLTDIFLYDRTTGINTLVSHSTLSPTISATDGSETPGLSADGRWVVYASRAIDLVTGQSDANAGTDVFLYDRTNGSNRIVSHVAGAPATTGSDYSFAPSISGDGTRVSFYSAALNLVLGQDNDIDSVQHLFLYDRAADSNQLVDHQTGAPLRTSDGNTGSTVAEDPAIFSGDGKFLAFVSTSTNLVAGQTDTNDRDDVFLFGRITGATELVSREAGSATTTADDYSYSPSLSADGAQIAWRSGATNLVTGQIDTNTFQDVFVFDRPTGATTLVSHALGQPATAGNTGSGTAPRIGSPAVSPDGRLIAFTSAATDLIDGHIDENGFFNEDLFLFDRTTGVNVLVSHTLGAPTTTGPGASGDTVNLGGPAWSADGKLLLFASRADGLIAGDFNQREDVFARPVQDLIQPLSVRSVKTHGAAGVFEIDLPLTGSLGIECRTGGATGDHRIVLTFAGNISVSGIDVTSGTGEVSGFSVNGAEVTVNLTSVANAQTIMLTLSAVNDATRTNDVAVPMGILLGDTSADGVVNSGDVTQARRQSGQITGQTNFRTDPSIDGVINSADITLVRRASGSALP